MFKVIGPGVATDGTSFEGQPIEYFFPKELELEPGTMFSADVPQNPRINVSSVFIESGPKFVGERKEFSSAGPAPRIKQSHV